VVNLPQNSKGNIGSWGAECQRGIFSQISGRISETVQDGTKVTINN